MAWVLTPWAPQLKRIPWVIFRPTREPSCNRLVEGITANCLSVSKSPDSRLLVRSFPASGVLHPSRSPNPRPRNIAGLYEWGDVSECCGIGTRFAHAHGAYARFMTVALRRHPSSTWRTTNKCDKRDKAPNANPNVFHRATGGLVSKVRDTDRTPLIPDSWKQVRKKYGNYSL